MGKISDALDKIGSLDGIEDSDANNIQEHLKDPAPSKALSDNAVENLINSTEVGGRLEKTIAESASADAASSLVVDTIVKSGEVNREWDDRLFKAVNNDLVMPEIFNKLCTVIMQPPDGRLPPKTVMVASSIPKEGKSFITANLGVSFANGEGSHCVMVDCNLRNPSLAHSFGLKQKRGLVDYLKEQQELASLTQETSLQKLSILPSGNTPYNPAELLISSRIGALIHDLSKMYEDCTIIFDSPPLLTAAESIVLADKVDAIIMVVRQGRAKKAEAERFVDVVNNNKILGIVFNDVPID